MSLENNGATPSKPPFVFFMPEHELCSATFFVSKQTPLPEAKSLAFHSVFAPSERAKRPTTLHFTMFLRLRKGRGGQKPCILLCFRAFGKGDGAKLLMFY